jgi:hypothetical protein
MSDARRHPALQAAAGMAALLALTWPLLVFDRPLYVLGSFFGIWILVIGSLCALSAAQKDAEEDGAFADKLEEDVDAGSD